MTEPTATTNLIALDVWAMGGFDMLLRYLEEETSLRAYLQVVLYPFGPIGIPGLDIVPSLYPGHRPMDPFGNLQLWQADSVTVVELLYYHDGLPVGYAAWFPTYDWKPLGQKQACILSPPHKLGGFQGKAYLDYPVSLLKLSADAEDPTAEFQFQRAYLGTSPGVGSTGNSAITIGETSSWPWGYAIPKSPTFATPANPSGSTLVARFTDSNGNALGAFGVASDPFELVIPKPALSQVYGLATDWRLSNLSVRCDTAPGRVTDVSALYSSGMLPKAFAPTPVAPEFVPNLGFVPIFGLAGHESISPQLAPIRAAESSALASGHCCMRVADLGEVLDEWRVQISESNFASCWLKLSFDAQWQVKWTPSGPGSGWLP